ncbi:lipoma HMGIC fusion partner [Echinococcus multilocularis]|uniref:Lipoma HMGIC fusion partner n=1 Tax=Echinococcus multilocularis TaxID=6211 RepID=A0A068YFK3_ECHMU|nr:lipoma HMGIC fusion partner [Echinococcus multilocularis]
MTLQWQVICLLLIWSLLTVLAAGICSICCLLPFWISGSVEVTAFGGKVSSSVSHLGLFRRCGYPTYRLNGDVEWIQGCGYYPLLESVPHWVWRMALILLIIAACLLVFLAFFVICAGACTPLLRRNSKLLRACSYVYLDAGALCLVACLVYPFGWSNNSEILQICGPGSGSFKLGSCEVGWAYVLTIAGGVISVVLSGMPNLLHSLLQRNALPPPLPPSDAKYSLLPPSHFHLPHFPPPWYIVEPSMSLRGNGGGVNCNVRIRPHSLMVPSDSSALWDLTRRLSCSVFCSIPEQHHAELAPTKPSECQSTTALPEDEITIITMEKDGNEHPDNGKITSDAENIS